jgi:hypothetical protein
LEGRAGKITRVATACLPALVLLWARAGSSTGLGAAADTTARVSRDSLETRSLESVEGMPIARIEVLTLPVLTDTNLVSRVVNATHITTREGYVENELLFEAGDPYHYEVSLESEKLLRESGLFADVWITPTLLPGAPGESDSLLVQIVTQDRYSLYFSAGIRGGGGTNEREVQVGEDNFRGRAELVNLGYFQDVSERRFRIGYTIPRIVARWRSVVRAAYQQDRVFDRGGGLFQVEVERPLYAREAEWAVDVWFNRQEESQYRLIGDEVRLAGKSYDGGPDALPPAQQFLWANRLKALEYGAVFVRSWGYEHKVNAELGFRVFDQTFHPMEELDPLQDHFFRTQVVPLDRDRKELLVGLEFEHVRYDTDRDLLLLGTTEDVTLGYVVGLRWSLARRDLGSDSTYARPRLEFQGNWRYGEVNYFQTVLTLENELARSGSLDHTALLDVRTYVRTWDNSLLTAAGRTILREKTDPDDLSALGGDSGLRGYLADSFLGPDLLRFNIEWRSPPVRIWHAYLAGVAFVDAGHAGEGISMRNLRVGAGLGIRIGLPEFSNTLTYIDLGYGFDQPNISVFDRFTFGDQPPF